MKGKDLESYPLLHQNGNSPMNDIIFIVYIVILI